MNKEPQVGDIYLYKNEFAEFKEQVYYVGIESGQYVIKTVSKCGTSILVGVFKELNSEHTYLGHSKATIDDLFKTENEE